MNEHARTPHDQPLQPAGWYTDPARADRLRWWDGSEWTDQVAVRTPDGAAPTAPVDPSLAWLMPVGRSGWAIAAGYAGLFGLILFPAPLALLLGLVAIWDLRRHPDKKGMGRAIFGLVVGVLGTAALVFLFVAQ